MILAALSAPRRTVAEIDHLALWCALILLFTGLVMVYSASIATAEGNRFSGHQPAYFLIRHSVFLAIGFVVAVGTFQIPLSLWQKVSPFLFLLGVALLIIVLIPGLGKSVNGARRWINLGSVNLQPSEFMKLFVVLYAADYTVRKMAVMHNLKQAFLPMAGAMVLVAALLLREPDFGAFVVIVCEENLTPPANQLLAVPAGADASTKNVVKIWNRFCGSFQELADQLRIDPGAAVAVFLIESGGEGFGGDGRLKIRFENHIFSAIGAKITGHVLINISVMMRPKCG